jgi:hypothetical protein
MRSLVEGLPIMLFLTFFFDLFEGGGEAENSVTGVRCSGSIIGTKKVGPGITY